MVPQSLPCKRVTVRVLRCPTRIIGPMLVAIDVGNSEVKLALVRDGRILAIRRRPSRSRIAAHDAEGLLADALGADARGGPLVDAMVLVSVVPAWTDAFTDLAAHMGRPVLMATSETIPMSVRGPDPDRVGADRLLGAFAAMRLHGRPVIVVDLGTATTVDAVDGGGCFIGGAIAPGLELGLAALASGTALLPRVTLETPEHAIGNDTAEAIRSGVVFGHVGLVRELVVRIGREATSGVGHEPRVVVTGGISAAPWTSLLDMADVIDPQLTLKGLALLHTEVRERVA